ncbi:carboxylating nicotinate-nucleotide diphosphorylase [Phenylobacterium sp.]|jgi:nicotinate-nucleotide pyrophosphorylase (carboxylating)|uniref:carboxylating nicotinate-nucleotide diphosphorylase n=1 Tax=Phenylobacterium sp. TaxID=1871053 RepID=UPI0035B3DC69
MIAPIPDVLIQPVVAAALAEDLGRAGDVTAQACIDADARLAATFGVRQSGTVAGLACARLAVLALDPSARFEVLAADGDRVEAGEVLARVEANARALLSAERTALNLLGRLSGVASLTRTYVDVIEGTGARIADTRKTTPGLRHLEKYAVRCGGGLNHRFGLDDAILIKDNHVAACGGVGEALKRARAAAGHLMKIEVEVDSLAQLEEALPHRPDVIMLDNFDLDDLAAAVRMAGGEVTLEASGGVNLQTVRGIAESGVQVISVGALTHSAAVLDIGLDAA